ncbi:hypothetical protein F511_47227 [Dorcoceras hygrometricum]|uniref:Uncharacterized protein n=1 Tax=Dorcoceras hygrometricum TaxID=472368 RepID=A0A2Z6ZXX7_9LAMI|nr:hypothetical protein F511_47227 [Dorcoceras hygrometricum]
MMRGLAAPTAAPPAASVRPSGRTGCTPPRNDCVWPLAIAGHHAWPARMASCAVARAMGRRARRLPAEFFFFVSSIQIRDLDEILATIVLKDPSLGSDTTVGEPWQIRIPSPDEAAEEQN